MLFRQLDDYKGEKSGRVWDGTSAAAGDAETDQELEHIVQLISHKEEDETAAEVKVRLNQVSNALRQITSFSDDFVGSSGVVEFMQEALNLSPDVALFVVPGLLQLLAKSQLFVEMFVGGNPTAICAWILGPSKEIRRAAVQIVNELLEWRVACEWILGNGVMDAVLQNAKELVELFNTNPRLGEDAVAMYEQVLSSFHSLAFQMGDGVAPMIGVFVDVLDSTVNCEYSFRFNMTVIKILLLLSANGFMEPLLADANLRVPMLGLLFDDVARPCYPYLIEFESEIVRQAPNEIAEQAVTEDAASRCVELFVAAKSDSQLSEACLHLFTNLAAENPAFVSLVSDNEQLWRAVLECADTGNVKLQESSQWFIWAALGASPPASICQLLPMMLEVLPDSFLSDNTEFLVVVLDSISSIMQKLDPCCPVFQEFVDSVLAHIPDLFERSEQDVVERAHALWEAHGNR